MSVYIKIFLDQIIILLIFLILFTETNIYPKQQKYQKYDFFPIFFVNFPEI